MCLEGGLSGSISLLGTDCTHDLYIGSDDIR